MTQTLIYLTNNKLEGLSIEFLVKDRYTKIFPKVIDRLKSRHLPQPSSEHYTIIIYKRIHEYNYFTLTLIPIINLFG